MTELLTTPLLVLLALVVIEPILLVSVYFLLVLVLVLGPLSVAIFLFTLFCDDAVVVDDVESDQDDDPAAKL